MFSVTYQHYYYMWLICIFGRFYKIIFHNYYDYSWKSGGEWVNAINCYFDNNQVPQYFNSRIGMKKLWFYVFCTSKSHLTKTFSNLVATSYVIKL